MKQTICETHYDYTLKDADSIDEAIQALKSLKRAMGGSSLFRLDTTGYDDVEVTILYDREETDREYENRVQKELRAAEKKAEETRKKQIELQNKRDNEIKEYERLKKIYGKT